ncbi:hypothetical protein KUV89_00545 [Marinobacter hydrocarbonoclasticus]|nr:hypothetical protein [Marinobacter nauticus]
MSHRHRSEYHQGLEWEFMKEQSGALGRAGKALKAAIAHYRSLADSDPGKADALAKVREALWHLEMQREFVGFVDANMASIVEAFDVPPEALEQRGPQRS